MRHDMTDIHCAYEQLPNGIHKITLLRNTRQAVDELFTHIQYINSITPPDHLVSLIADPTQAEMFPMGYFMSRLKTLDRRNSPGYRVVVINDGGLIIHLLNAFLKTIPVKKTIIRFMPASDEQQILEWLLQFSQTQSEV